MCIKSTRQVYFTVHGMETLHWIFRLIGQLCSILTVAQKTIHLFRFCHGYQLARCRTLTSFAPLSSVLHLFLLFAPLFFCSALFCFSSSSVTLWHWFLTAVPLLATTRQFLFPLHEHHHHQWPCHQQLTLTKNAKHFLFHLLFFYSSVFCFTCQGEVAPFTPCGSLLLQATVQSSSCCLNPLVLPG